MAKKEKKIFDPDVLFHKDAIKGDKAENFSFSFEKLQKCLNALASDHSSCIVYGERGVGKTSFAWQVLSILIDENTVYDKNKVLVIGKNKKFKCVFFKCDSNSDLADLLLNIMRPSLEPFSLSRVFPEFYDSDLQHKFKLKLKFNLFGFLDTELEGEEEKEKSSKVADDKNFNTLSPEAKIKHLFNDLLREINNVYPEYTLIFFVDEMEQLADTSGLGKFLKNLNLCKFVLLELPVIFLK